MLLDPSIVPDIHMWFVLLITAAAVVLFVREKLPLEVTSIGLLTVLLLFGQFFPVVGESGGNALSAGSLLAGFANPSLIAVLALLVMGQAIIHSDALRPISNAFIVKEKRLAWVSIAGILIFILVLSAFLNNTPLVIIAIPIVQALAASAGVSESRVMIPLSYAAILGGSMTLIGSSTNLLVSSTMMELGYESLQFFDFIIPGAMLAAVGFLYVFLIAPHLLPDRSTMARELAGDEKEFVAEIDVAEDSKLVGMECNEGRFDELYDLNVKLIQRGGHFILPPFEGYKIEAGDIMIVSATRDTLTDILAKFPGFLLSEKEELMIQKHAESDEDSPSTGENDGGQTRMLAEMMITPASRLLDMSLEHANFERQFGAIVLGIQRRARVVRRRLGRIRLEPGDVLLVAGERSKINALRDSTDFILLSGSKRELPVPGKAPIAAAIFIGVVAMAGMGMLSIPVAAITGAVLMILTGCLNIRQATRAIDRKIFLLVGSMLALGTAMQATGGAEFLAHSMLSLPFVETPFTVVAVLFLIVAIATNVLSNNACAILFTPIAMSLTQSFVGVADMNIEALRFIFAVTVIFGANCSFASPIGYQTNLLVMGPGHYRFRDFLKAGVPLMFILWLTYCGIVKYYFGL